MKERKIIVKGLWPKIAWFDDEYIRTVGDPHTALAEIKRRGLKADIFTFRQRVPDSDPEFPYYHEWEDQAILQLESYEDWFYNKANRGARRATKRAIGQGLIVKEVPFDDDFVDGITEVINETPIRQGRPYPYYGMSRDEVQSEFGQDLDKCRLLACYLEGRIIGFIKLGIEGRSAVPFGMVSMNRYHDKCPQNLLISEAVKKCIEQGVPYLWYGLWHEGGLGNFKINNGFSRFAIPRYYIPMNLSGKLALKMRLHRGVKEMMPTSWRHRLRQVKMLLYRSRSA